MKYHGLCSRIITRFSAIVVTSFQQIWVEEVTKKGKQKWCMGDPLAGEECSPAVLDFLRSTHVGKAAPPEEENWDSEDEAEEAEVAEVEEQAE